jgi:hypothetical protein
MRLPVPTTLDVKTLSGGKADIKRSYTKNVVYEQTADGKVLASQRPSVQITTKAADEGVGAKGRGIYYWQKEDLLYVVNDNVVYIGNYDVTLAQNITSGVEPVSFHEIGEYLVILDAENNEGWAIGPSTVVMTKITDLNFPPNQTPALQITKGGAVLNETLFVGCTNGELWNSAVEDPTSWAGTDFTTAEVEKDQGVYVAKQNQNIVFFGRKTIEFFYWAANPTGSPVNVRTDITIDIGVPDYSSVWSDGNKTYFYGLSKTGGAGVYILQGFEVSKISTPDLDRILQTVINTTGGVFASGFTIGGRSYYIMTTYGLVGGLIEPIESYCFDGNGWSIWSISLSGYSDYPIVNYSSGISGLPDQGVGILENGDIFTVLDRGYGVDIGAEGLWVADGWVADGWVSGAGVLNGEYIDIEIVLEPYDAGTMDYKYMANLRPVLTPQTDYYNQFPPSIDFPAASTQLNVQWSDDEIENYGTEIPIDLFDKDDSIVRCGRFRTRQHKLTYAGQIHIEIEGIEFDLEKGM